MHPPSQTNSICHKLILTFDLWVRSRVSESKVPAAAFGVGRELKGRDSYGKGCGGWPIIPLKKRKKAGGIILLQLNERFRR